MTERSTPRAPALDRLVSEDAVGQLRRGVGAMARLGSENGRLMLDWVEAVPRLLAAPARLAAVEAEAQALVARGIRHIVWAGMGGSVLTVRVLGALGFCEGFVTIHPLDSTDPAALNALIRQLATAKGITLPEALDARSSDETVLCRMLLSDVLLVAVAMGMTSEEPISHLDWFGGLLERGGLPPAAHLLVMALPASYLDAYARSRQLPILPLQLDGGQGTPGRMSAPSTRVFLLPVALDLAARGAPSGTLHAILAAAWAAYDLDGATAAPARHPYVRLAAALADASPAGSCGLYFEVKDAVDSLRRWTEQLMEESLGKGGKGVLVFAGSLPKAIPIASLGLTPIGGVRLRITSDAEASEPVPGVLQISVPLLGAQEPESRLAGLAATFLGLQLTMALFGYLNDIPFAGQPAVEHYKSRARQLRAAGDPLADALASSRAVVEAALTLLPPPGTPSAASPAQAVAAALAGPLTYVDLTVNGELPPGESAAVQAWLRRLGDERLGVAVKLRRAPAAYHSTEQSEMDGPPGVVSLRALALRSEMPLLGDYDATFLRAQAVGTWQAMNERGRTCFLLLFDGPDADLGAALCDFLDAVAKALPVPAGPTLASEEQTAG